MKQRSVTIAIATAFILVATVYSQHASQDMDQDLIADETTIIFRPLFVYKQQQAEAERKRKIREEWQKQHPNLNYHDYVHSKT